MNLYGVPCELTLSAAGKVGQNKLYLPIPDSASCVMAEINNKAKAKPDRNGGEGFVLMDRWRDDRERKSEKRMKRKETLDRGRVERVGEHVLLSVCLLIPLDFFCLPFPRSQC